MNGPDISPPLFRPDFDFHPKSTSSSDDETLGPHDACKRSVKSVLESSNETVTPPEMSIIEPQTVDTEVEGSSFNDKRLKRIAGQSIIWRAIAGRSGRGPITSKACQRMLHVTRTLHRADAPKNWALTDCKSFRALDLDLRNYDDDDEDEDEDEGQSELDRGRCTNRPDFTRFGDYILAA
jgi:hypothetical protein